MDPAALVIAVIFAVAALAGYAYVVRRL